MWKKSTAARTLTTSRRAMADKEKPQPQPPDQQPKPTNQQKAVPSVADQSPFTRPEMQNVLGSGDMPRARKRDR